MITEKDLNCSDCGKLREFFMVRNNIWNKYATNKEDIYCLECFEKRMDRKIRTRDFDWSSILNWVFYSEFAPKRVPKQYIDEMFRVFLQANRRESGNERPSRIKLE